VASAEHRSLSVEETSALLPAVYRTEINDVLLTALVQTFTQWRTLPTGGSHGREAIANDIDLSRTIGWFTTIFPVLLTWGFPARGGTEGHKEQLGPESGHYGVLRYLSGDTSVTEQLQIPKPEIQLSRSVRPSSV